MLMRQREFPFVSCTAEGCTQSFQEAKSWYSRAVAGLSTAVREGESCIAVPLRAQRRALREQSRRFRESTRGATPKHHTMLLARHNLCPSCHRKGEGEL